MQLDAHFAGLKRFFIYSIHVLLVRHTIHVSSIIWFFYIDISINAETAHSDGRLPVHCGKNPT